MEGGVDVKSHVPVVIRCLERGVTRVFQQVFTDQILAMMMMVMILLMMVMILLMII